MCCFRSRLRWMVGHLTVVLVPPIVSVGSFKYNIRFPQLGAEKVYSLISYKIQVHDEASLLLGC